MKRILWFDSVGGASGDMILAALVDLGVRPEELNRELGHLGGMHLAFEAHPHSSHGLHGTRLAVQAEEVAAHGHHGHHGHSPHRHLSDIRGIIEATRLPPAVRQMSLRVFERLADAEAHVHGTHREEVHFHEVGALDAIADITGGCLSLHLLGIDAIGFSPLPQGHGVIHCAHGTFPNPPPGTVELLKGLPIAHADEPFELVTPTGAALLSTWRGVDRWPDGWTVRAVGHGFGQRTLNSRPNLLRAMILEAPGEQEPEGESCLVLETNLDDTTPELMGSLVQKLMAAGAFDVFTTAIQMKKQRPGTLLTVLCGPARKAALLDLIFTESTTFGVREYLTRRTMLERTVTEVTTPRGAIRVKIGRWQGKPVTASPEYDDCVRVANEAALPVRQVYEEAQAAARRCLA